jgi:transposase-like protein
MKKPKKINMDCWIKCPACKSDLKGAPIPEEDRHNYSSGSTHFSRLIGIEIRGGYDGVSFWECPDCHARWDRFTGEKVVWHV